VRILATARPEASYVDTVRSQCVLVGARLDTFAFRRADMRDRVEIFELDHPRSQVSKRDRLVATRAGEP
jgi:O-methyltransferase involved in polyketide biosynthesis